MQLSGTVKRHFKEIDEREYGMEDGDVLAGPASFEAEGRPAATCSVPFGPSSAAAPSVPANTPLVHHGYLSPPPPLEHDLGLRNEHVLAAPPASACTDVVWSSQGTSWYWRTSKRKRLSTEQLGRDMAVMSLEDGTNRAEGLCSSTCLAQSVPGGITLGYVDLQRVDRPPAAKQFDCFANPSDVPMDQHDDGDTSDEEAAAKSEAAFRLSFKPRIPDHVLRPPKLPETGALVLYQPPVWRVKDFVGGDVGSLTARVGCARKQRRGTGYGVRDSED